MHSALGPSRAHLIITARSSLFFSFFSNDKLYQKAFFFQTFLLIEHLRPAFEQLTFESFESFEEKLSPESCVICSIFVHFVVLFHQHLFFTQNSVPSCSRLARKLISLANRFIYNNL